MEEDPKKRDIWEKIGIVLHSSGGLLTAITVAIISLVGSSYLKDRELTEERQLAYDTNVRVYTDLMSRREESESSLRKDMFVSIIQSFLRTGASSMDERVLNLELLSYNFHESLNLKPLFVYMERQVRASGDANKKYYLERLHKVATEISRKQLLVLEGVGQKTDRIVDFENFEENSGGFQLDDATLTLEGIKRQFSLFVISADRETQELKVRLEIRTTKEDLENVETSSVEFWIGYFDFPMIDNTRLTQDQRAAVILNAFDEASADVTLAYFPGSYASLKEKPYYQEVLQNLKQMNEAQKAKP